MKILKTFLLAVVATVFIFTSCEKNETPESYNTISGVLSPGENVTAEDLSEITVYLAKLNENVDPAFVTTEIEDFSFVDKTTPAIDGTYHFDNLDAGNYLLFLSDDYILGTDTFAVAIVDGTTENKITREICRTVPDNGKVKDFEIWIKNKSSYSNLKLFVTYDGVPYGYPYIIMTRNSPQHLSYPDDGKLKLQISVDYGGEDILSPYMSIPKWFEPKEVEITKDGKKLASIKFSKSFFNYTIKVRD